MHIETVNLEDNSYPIFIGEGASLSLENFEGCIAGKDIAIVTNEVVAPLYLNEISDLFSHMNVIEYILPDGEQEKKLKTVHKIIDRLMEAGLGRDSTLIALGGGVVGDITGFTASIFMRGINFIQIPTTLLAQVDASVGGKTAVNHKSGKNLIGSFYQPQCVICDSIFLETLKATEISAGLSEIIKYGLIYDKEFFQWLQKNIQQILSNDPVAVAHAIQRSCAIKAEIVAQDEKEQSVRALLNFGHTFGHAIEKLTGYGNWTHGDAVAVGMVLAARLSENMSLITPEDVQDIEEILTAANLPISLPNIDPAELLAAMQSEKKVKDRNIQLVLLKNIGEAFLTADYSQEDLVNILRDS
ncbi:MAG: 3-dehydroquinate synthase [Gammaproteobacteria bacterium]|nr:3-dehydroquinate synthase [Gammaproteobacteria bacterium]